MPGTVSTLCTGLPVLNTQHRQMLHLAIPVLSLPVRVPGLLGHIRYWAEQVSYCYVSSNILVEQRKMKLREDMVGLELSHFG